MLLHHPSSHLLSKNFDRCDTEDTESFIPKFDSLQFKLQYEDKSHNPIPLEDAYYCSEEDISMATLSNVSSFILFTDKGSSFSRSLNFSSLS